MPEVDEGRPAGGRGGGALAAIAHVTRHVDRMHGLSAWRRPMRLARTGLRRALLRVHSPTSEATAITAEVPLGRGLRIRVNTLELVQRDVFLVGADPEIRELIRRHLGAGGVGIDIGAHIGLYTVLMAGAHPDVRVLSCEPNPKLFARLQENIRLNRLEGVKAEQVAVLAAAGPATFFVPRDGRHVAGGSAGQGLHRHLEDSEQITVRGVTLDDLGERVPGGRVALVKIDVEGLEAGVLSGGQGVLRRDRPALIFEFTRDWWKASGASLESTMGLLQDAGYSRFDRISWHGRDPLPGGARDVMNVLATAPALRPA